MMLKTLIQHQPWNEEYRLHLVETEDNGDICRVVNESLQMIDRLDKKLSIIYCQLQMKVL